MRAPTRRYPAAVVLAGVMLSAPVALAQTRPPAKPAPPQRPAPPPTALMRGFLVVGGGGQFGTSTFSETRRDPLNAEEQQWSADYEASRGLEIEAGGGWRVWRRVLVGGAYTYAQSGNQSGVSALLPHPFFFDRPREITGESSTLSQREQALHASLLWNRPVGRRLELDVFGGPSFVHVSRELVSAVEYTEAYPYDTATFTRAAVGKSSKGRPGAHAGATLAWRLSPRLGVGATVRYTWAAVDLATPAGGSVGFDIGGIQTAVGLRLAFQPRSSAWRPAPISPPRRR